MSPKENQSLNGLKRSPKSPITLSRDILTHRKLSQEQPLRVDSGVSPSKSRTAELSFPEEPPLDALPLFTSSKPDSKLEKSHEENVFYFSTFIQNFENLMIRIYQKKIKESFKKLVNYRPEKLSVSHKMMCKSEKQLLKNIDKFLFKTEVMEEEQKIESIQQLESFEDVESILRSALSKQISNKKGRRSNILSSQMNNLTESVRNSNKSGKGVRVSVGSSFRGSGKSIHLHVASPINAGQLMNELIFSKKNGQVQGKLGGERKEQKDKGGKEDIKGDNIWNEASTKQSL